MNEALVYTALILSMVAVALSIGSYLIVISKSRKKKDPVQCLECGSKKVTVARSNSNRLICISCGASFAASKEKQIQEPPKPIEKLICKYCDQAFEKKEKLQKHIATKHITEIDI